MTKEEYDIKSNKVLNFNEIQSGIEWSIIPQSTIDIILTTLDEQGNGGHQYKKEISAQQYRELVILGYRFKKEKTIENGHDDC